MPLANPECVIAAAKHAARDTLQTLARLPFEEGHISLLSPNGGHSREALLTPRGGIFFWGGVKCQEGVTDWFSQSDRLAMVFDHNPPGVENR